MWVTGKVGVLGYSYGVGPERPHRVEYISESVGKNCRRSKKRIIWRFSFGEDGDEHELMMLHSRLSGKVQLMLNSALIYEMKGRRLKWIHSWPMASHVCTCSLRSGAYSFFVDRVEYSRWPRSDPRLVKEIRREKYNMVKEFEAEREKMKRWRQESATQQKRAASPDEGCATLPKTSCTTGDSVAAPLVRKHVGSEVDAHFCSEESRSVASSQFSDGVYPSELSPASYFETLSGRSNLICASSEFPAPIDRGVSFPPGANGSQRASDSLPVSTATHNPFTNPVYLMNATSSRAPVHNSSLLTCGANERDVRCQSVLPQTQDWFNIKSTTSDTPSNQSTVFRRELASNDLFQFPDLRTAHFNSAALGAYSSQVSVFNARQVS